MEYIVTKLDCGAPLYFKPMSSDIKSVSLIAAVRIGTRDERPEDKGLTHALEHMLFKGNRRFSDSLEVTRFVERNGIYANAWTSKEELFCIASGHGRYLDRSIAYLKHLLDEPTFPDHTIEAEMRVIVEEIKRARDTYEEHVGEIAETIALGSHPLARSILGTEDTVSSFRRSDFIRHHEEYFYPENMIFVAAGNVRSAELASLLNEAFPGTGGRKPKVRPSENSIFPAPGTQCIERDVEQLYASLVTPLPHAGHPDTMALRLYERMIDGGMSFPLFQELREKRGLCYHAAATVSQYTDVSSFALDIGTDARRWSEAEQALFHVMTTYAADEELFEIAREVLAIQIETGHESSFNCALAMRNDIQLRGRLLTAEERIRELKAISLSDVRRAVKTHLSPKRFSRAFIAPHGFKP